MSVMLAAALLLGAPAGEQHPILHFDAASVPALRQRCQEDKILWPQIRQSADDLLKPGALDPSRVAEGDEDRPQTVRGHFFGRRLMGQLEPLGFAYQVTGDARYGELGARILVEAARRLPPDAPPVGPGSFAGARGDILRALTSGYDWLYPALSEGERAEVANAIAAYVRDILSEAERPDTWWIPYHNFIGVAVGAAGRASIALAGRFPQEAPQWREKAERLTRGWLDKGFDDKGAYFEGVLYAAYGLDDATLFADALKRCGGSDLFTHPRWRQVPRFYAASLLPGEPIYDALNDSSYAGITTPSLLRMAAEADGLARWLWQETGGATSASPYNLIWANKTEPVSPKAAGLPWAEHFPGRGLAILRTGWGPDDVMLSLESGPYYKVTHNQADKCQVTLYGAGGRWLIDSGYGNNREPEGTAQTVAHNLILIDGKGQAVSGAGAGTNGRILAFEAKEAYGYVLGDATEAYQRNAGGTPGVALERAYRHALLVRPEGGAPAYALLADVLRVDGKPHTFDWLLHTPAENEVARAVNAIHLRAQRGASGGAYVETPAGETGKGAISFPITLPREGRYRVWARVRASLPEPSKSDSFFVRWDDSEPFAWHAPTSTSWTWGVVAELGGKAIREFTLTAGPHRLSVMTREAGAAIDRLAITSDPNWVPGVGAARALEVEAEAAAEVTAPMCIRKEDGPAPGECLIRWLTPESLSLAIEPYRDHPRVRARVTATDPVFVTLLYPHAPGAPEPQAAIRGEGTERTITLTWPTYKDTITLALDGARPVVFSRSR